MSPQHLTSETTFSNYLINVDAYSIIQNIYSLEIFTTEEVMDE